MKLGLRGRMLWASGALALVVGGVLALLVLATRDLRDAADLARHSEEVIATANRAERLVIDLQTGQRGFIITHAERFLEPYEAARRQLPAQLDALVRLVADNPAQERRAQRLRQDARSYLEDWSIPLVEQARSDPARAAAAVSGGEGKRRMDAIRAEADEFVSADAELARQRRERAASAADLAIALGAGGLAGSVLLILLFSVLFGRTTVFPIKRLAAVADRLAAGDLTARVPEQGVAEVGGLASSFNAMAASLEDGRTELEQQNAELEHQTVLLEENQVQLSAQAERFRRLLEAAPEATVIIDRSGKIVLVNARIETLFGYTRDELLDESVDVLLPEPARGAHADHRAGYFSAPHTRAMGAGLDLQGRRKDGSLFPAEISLSPIEMEQGLLVIGTVLDITERKRAEEEIRVLNQQLEHRSAELEQQNAELETQTVLLEENHVQLSAANEELHAQQAELERAVAELADEKERIESFYRFGESLAAETDVETLAQTVLGQTGDYTRAEAGALYALDPAHGDVYSLVATRGLDRARLSPTVAAGEGLTGRALTELRALRDEQGASGLRLPGLTEEIPVRHELHIPLVHAGRAVGALVLGRAGESGFSADELGGIGHLADQAAVALANALTLRQARRLADINKAVLDATVDGITMLDVEGSVALVNNAQRRLLEDVFELPPEGEPAGRVHEVAPRTADPAGFLAAIEARRADPEAEIADEFTLLDPPRTFARFSAPVRGADGSALGRIVVLRDVTAERAAEQFRTELIATVSHELRTPLTGILGFSELLVNRDVPVATRTHYLQTIHNEARRLTDLVNDFLDVQRFESGRIELADEGFSLGEVLEAEIAIFAGQSDRHTLVLDIQGTPPPVRGDRNRTSQIVANLLSNAIKYSPEGGEVTVSLGAGEGVVRASITDRGFGIPVQQQPRVFTKFFRVDSTDTRTIGGTGLGLTLCKEIVEAQGGRIGFESVQGVGSTFWFELPVA